MPKLNNSGVSLPAHACEENSSFPNDTFLSAEPPVKQKELFEKAVIGADRQLLERVARVPAALGGLDLSASDVEDCEEEEEASSEEDRVGDRRKQRVKRRSTSPEPEASDDSQDEGVSKSRRE